MVLCVLLCGIRNVCSYCVFDNTMHSLLMMISFMLFYYFTCHFLFFSVDLLFVVVVAFVSLYIPLALICGQNKKQKKIPQFRYYSSVFIYNHRIRLKINYSICLNARNVSMLRIINWY